MIRCWTLALQIILKIIFNEQKARRDPVLDIGFRNCFKDNFQVTEGPPRPGVGHWPSKLFSKEQKACRAPMLDNGLRNYFEDNFQVTEGSPRPNVESLT